MLNISKNSIEKKIDLSQFKSDKTVSNKRYNKKFNQLSIVFLILLLIILFLPWTQNIAGKGKVTTLKPSQRPQTIQSSIPGRIEQWFVKEGDYVKEGDTLLRISEIKSDYFDENLVERVGGQIKSKSLSLNSYQSKIDVLEQQISALQQEKILKLKQAKNKIQQAKLKVKIDQANLKAINTNKLIIKTQFDRVFNLEKEGLKSKKNVEEKNVKLQEINAKYVSQENKLLNSKNEVNNAEIELSRINAIYIDKISKAKSDLFTAKSNKFNTQTEIFKLKNNYTNYSRRNLLQYVLAPQSGKINRTLKSGIGETFKVGEELILIMPENYDLAVETYIKPIDIPLIHLGEKVRVEFDGWPAIVFSGWESVSYGTYGAKVVAIDNFISQNGMYRVLLAPDENDYKWPRGIRVGSGARTIALLDDVPIWYELWRQVNGFPPNFYNPNQNKKISKK